MGSCIETNSCPFAFCKGNRESAQMPLSKTENDQLISQAKKWFESKGYAPFEFQLSTWNSFLSGKSGLVNAPTGSGKTFALMIPIVLESLIQKDKEGIRAIWITPIRSLGREILEASNELLGGLKSTWKASLRTGDTDPAMKMAFKKKPTQILVTTPESLSVLLSYSKASELLGSVETVVADEWHELMGSKRGVQLELALSRLRALNPGLRTWGISATIGNLEEALQVLSGNRQDTSDLIRANIQKGIEIDTIYPAEIETYPVSGHLGIKLIDKVISIIESNNSTLIFTNTRAQCEIWYQHLLQASTDLAGVMAMHHGSMDKALRTWVEDGLDRGVLKVVVCTSSLDLGVDFRAVDAVVQVGSPKGVARFLQRAGRSGHQPGALSKIFFLPTHSLELLEAAALQRAVRWNLVESRTALHRSFDVLIQHLVTLSLEDGIDFDKVKDEIIDTHAFRTLNEEEWNAIVDFLSQGGPLDRYEEYKRLVFDGKGKWRIANKGMAMRHRLSIGTIVGDSAIQIQYLRGKSLGTVEEWFLMQLKPGDHFWFSGKALEFMHIKENTAFVRKSNVQKAKVPAWMGGRMPLSSPIADTMRQVLDEWTHKQISEEEISVLSPLLETQQRQSLVPKQTELLIEYFHSREGHHWLVYPFEGRLVHEGLAALVTYRLSLIKPVSFSIAMNDYGFELLTDNSFSLSEQDWKDLLSAENLRRDILSSLNVVELAKRRFRDIASISGLIFKGFPGKEKRERHLQSSSQMLFQVFKDHDPENLLFQQAYEEVLLDQLEENRLRKCLDRLGKADICMRYPERFTPFSFPIIADRLREKMSTERLEERIQMMKVKL
jgi:ATP-dependent Lhr-like helicase